MVLRLLRRICDRNYGAVTAISHINNTALTVTQLRSQLRRSYRISLDYLLDDFE
jgi:hypothetical protein